MSRVIANNLAVEFPVYGATSGSLKKALLRATTGGILSRGTNDRVTVRALDNLCFEFQEGDRVALTGHNGSGKSTLLRVIAGAYEPVSGHIEVRGKISSMLSLWLGMDLEATGYENIHMRALLMGLTKPEIDALLPDIEEFSELGDYLNMPLRTYSSGMAMRLAFAVLTSVGADILLMDEWLGVSDHGFFDKAQRRLRNLVDQAKILVLATHDENLIQSVCNKIVRLEHGAIVSIESIT
jgi:lipopolysaccharide transport system ATP-binding protein